MTWNCITLPGADDLTSGAAVVLIEALENAYEEAGRPAGADVFHRRRGDGAHVFYLSPYASSLFAEILLSTAAVECGEPGPDERKIRVRL